MYGRILFLLLLIVVMFSTKSLIAQNCSSCVIDQACDSVPAQPKLCPAVLPTDTAQQYYEADATFYMPASFVDAGSGVTVDLLQIEVVGFSGLPAGLIWTSYDYMGNDTLNFYPPADTSAGSERGCAKICGTPLMPGNYIITVSVLAYVWVPAISSNMTQATSFDIPLTIVPGGSGNSVFTMTNNQGCDSVSTDFSPILQSGGDPLYEYSWDFGDSYTSSSQSPSFTFATSGTYNVCLTVVDSCGSDTVCQSITVVNGLCPPPVANFTTTANNLVATFSDSSSATGVITYNWDFGDGSGTSSSQSPGYTYALSGTYNVCLTITDSCGTDFICQAVTVIDSLGCQPPTSGFTYTANGLSIVCSDTSRVTGTATYTWDFGDGSGTSSSQSPGYTYVLSGTYNVCLTIADSCGSDFICQTITLIDTLCTVPTVGFTYYANGLSITCADISSVIGSVTYAWDFGNSTTSTSEFPSHLYSIPGTYVVTGQIDVLKYVVSNVSVTTKNEDWCGDVEEPNYPIFGCTEDPDIYFRLNDNNSLYDSPTIDNSRNPSWNNLGAVIEGNQFTIQFFDEDIVSQHDDLGSTIINVTGPGTYSVSTISPFSSTQAIAGSLTIITQVETSYIDTDTITVYQPPIADTITFSPNDSICTGDSVTLVTGGGDSYQWYSDDTTLIVNATDSSYVAGVTGNYWCQLTDTIGCLAATDQLQVTVVSYPSVPSVINMGNNLLQTFSNGNLQWHYEGAPIPGETGQSYTITQDGNYFLTATNVLGCFSSSDTLFLTYVGVNEFLPIVSGLKIYPNPSKGDLTITLNTFGEQQIIINIRDIIGRTIYAQEYGSINGIFESALDLGDVSSGVYTVNIHIGDFSFHRKVLVK